MSAVDPPRVRQALRPFGTSIFTEMTALAVRTGAVNLGQGFPDFDAPDFVKEAAIRAIRDGHNQYARPYGIPALAAAIAAHQERFQGLRYDPLEEVTVVAGATEALHAAILGLLEAGDEAILFEPFYDAYRPDLAMAGATWRSVRLEAPASAIDPAALEAAVGPRTRAIVLNSPHNPTGKVFTRAELEAIAGFCLRHDLIAITDEVYEHLAFDAPHRSLATLPGMRERTIVVSSGGKTFGCTGWKIGWACAPRHLTAGLRAAHQFVTFTNGTPFQHAIAVALGAPDAFYGRLLADYRARRDALTAGLRAAGLDVQPSQGTYFAVADLGEGADDVAFCRALPERCGVAAIPLSAFYDEGAPVRRFVRFAFCKRDETLAEGIRRLAALRR
ncbi:MAG TPA: aminotransferase class I/II-fold pyridoxal phosphate-dependent enzyme [Anaeromyxobacteraceae bacterium]|nr:aminotransferase class I/II-fold pyridoxal phosphate-dependent enzyme [Anaeromyxobacteraceae bacterium]